MSIVRRWLEQLAAALKLRRPRWISILVDGNEEDQSAAHAIAHKLNPGRYDLVTYCKQYGGYDRNLPRLLAIPAL
ncbi:MAG: hypothetical protein WBW08_01655 [Methyloceanibacter sp.]